MLLLYRIPFVFFATAPFLWLPRFLALLRQKQFAIKIGFFGNQRAERFALLISKEPTMFLSTEKPLWRKDVWIVFFDKLRHFFPVSIGIIAHPFRNLRITWGIIGFYYSITVVIHFFLQA